MNVSFARLAAATACVALLLYALSTHNGRWPVAWLAAYIAALAPVLVLPIAYDQYAYLATATAIAIAASAWPALRRPPRAILATVAAIVVAHGAAVMSRMFAAGIVEQNLHTDLLNVVVLGPDTPITVAAEDPRDRWLLERLLHDVDCYHGVSMLNVRAETAEPVPGARRYLMTRDGHLAPAP